MDNITYFVHFNVALFDMSLNNDNDDEEYKDENEIFNRNLCTYEKSTHMLNYFNMRYNDWWGQTHDNIEISCIKYHVDGQFTCIMKMFDSKILNEYDIQERIEYALLMLMSDKHLNSNIIINNIRYKIEIVLDDYNSCFVVTK